MTGIDPNSFMNEMGTELKTLKDIKPLVRCLTCDKILPNLVHKMYIKKEAIKWVKITLETGSTWESLTPFIRFHNITSEDLKKKIRERTEKVIKSIYGITEEDLK